MLGISSRKKNGCGCKSCNGDSNDTGVVTIPIDTNPDFGSRLDFGVTGLEGAKENRWRSPLDGNKSIDTMYLEHAIVQGGSGKYYCKMSGSPPKICIQEGQPTGANCDPLPPVGDQACSHAGRIGKVTGTKKRKFIFGILEKCENKKCEHG